MAILKGKFLSGILGNLIFKPVKGRLIVTSKVASGQMKQTVGTKKASNTFCMSSRFSKNIRSVFEGMIAGREEGTCQSRLTGKLTASLGACRDSETRLFHFERNSFSNLSGFDFNADSPIEKNLSLMPLVRLKNNRIGVSYPKTVNEQKLRFPKHATACKLTATVGLIRLKDGKKVLNPDQQFIYLQKDELLTDQLNFSFKVPSGCLCIVVLFLSFYKKDVLLNSKIFNPAVICDALISPGVFQEDGQYTWEDMRNLKFN
ncbi:hypothetical protein H7F33_03790 [Pedobacter sp. PAMC26386]|nr:hypothetical protein H7F33_03790 [Pedobacter sp. PAMC26386]